MHKILNIQLFTITTFYKVFPSFVSFLGNLLMAVSLAARVSYFIVFNFLFVLATQVELGHILKMLKVDPGTLPA